MAGDTLSAALDEAAATIARLERERDEARAALQHHNDANLALLTQLREAERARDGMEAAFHRADAVAAQHSAALDLLRDLNAHAQDTYHLIDQPERMASALLYVRNMTRAHLAAVDGAAGAEAGNPRRAAGDEPTTRQPAGPGESLPPSAPTDRAVADRGAPPVRDNGATDSPCPDCDGKGYTTSGTVYMMRECACMRATPPPAESGGAPPAGTLRGGKETA